MEEGESSGMIAVVRGLRDAGLAVTLLDSGKQYTLLPNSALRPSSQRGPEPHQRSAGTDAYCDRLASRSRDSSAQATDGSYTSVYQRNAKHSSLNSSLSDFELVGQSHRQSLACTSHCKVKPTSPPHLMTEFPPQRTNFPHPGHDNFVVGGTGSGDTNFSPIRTDSYRGGGLVWSDRGSVFSPRPSREPDAFAKSLRRYPALSSERSAEIVERLITYTQAKNYAKSQARCSRNASDIDAVLEQNYQATTSRSSPRHIDPEARIRSRIEESPTRDRAKRSDDMERRPEFSRNYDVKCLRDVSRRVRENIKNLENIRNLSSYVPYNQPVVPTNRDRLYDVPETKINQHVPSKVNTEIQASAKMICREVATSPRLQASTRNVAVSMSLPSCGTDQTPEGAVSTQNPSYFKLIQKTTFLPLTIRKSVQTTVSLIDVPSIHRCENVRRSKSELNISKEIQDEFFDMLKDVINAKPETKWFCEDLLEELSHKLKVNNKDEGLKVSNCSMRYKSRYTTVFRAEVNQFVKSDDLTAIINDWLGNIPIETHDLFGRNIDYKEDILMSFVIRLKSILSADEIDRNKLKIEIIQILNDIPIAIHWNCNKRKKDYINRIANELIHILENYHNGKGTKRDDKISSVAKGQECEIKCQPTADEISNFVNDEIYDFVEKFRSELDVKQLQDIEEELADKLMDAVEALRTKNDKDILVDITALLCDSAGLFKHQAMYFANLLIGHFKETFNLVEQSQSSFRKNMIQTCMLAQHNSVESSDFSIGGLSEGDIQANLDLYVQKLSQQIEEWLTNLPVPIPRSHDTSFRQVVVHDLAGDIVDRHRYLELNPTSRGSDEDELENLKYQIFKWINKLVGEDQLKTIEHAPELMQRIRSIPVPMLMRPNASNMTGQRITTAGNSARANTSRTSSTGVTVNQKPVLGPSGPGGSMVDSNRSTIQGRRQSSPASRSSGSMYSQPLETQVYAANSTAERMSGSNPCCPSISQGGPLSPCCEPYSKACCKGNKNVTDSQMPMYGPQGPGGPMLENRRQSSPGRLNVEVGSSTGPMRIPESSQTPVFRPEGGMRVTTEMSSLAPNSAAGMPRRPVNLNTRPPATASAHLTVQQLTEEYDAFVKNWVQNIPIAAEQELAEKIRLGIYNGIWKAITKLKCQPQVIANPFYYEDALDDEIQELFSMLPQTPELEANMHMLKVNMIEKTTEVNNAIRMLYAPDTFKQELVDKVDVYVPRLATSDRSESPVKLYEDLEMLNLVEDFILYTRYKDDDPVKSNVYRKKLLDRVQKFVTELKRNHGKELKDIDPEVYTNDIVSALHQVPLPSDNTIKEEADEILLGIEVEQWYKGLPIAQNDDLTEQLKRRRLRDALTKRLHDMEKTMNLADSSSDRALRHEISKFLERIPLGKDETLNINFMVDELANRIKNRERERDLEGSGIKTVAFQDTVHYDDFTKNVMMSSSMAQVPEIRQPYQPVLPTIVSSGNVTPEGPCCSSFTQGGVLGQCCVPFSEPCCQPQSANVQQPSDMYRQSVRSQSIHPGTDNDGQWYSITSQSAIPMARRTSQPAYAEDRSTIPTISLMSNLDSAAPLGGTYITPPQLSDMPNNSLYYPQNTLVQDPRSYGSFDQQRPLSSSMNPSQAAPRYPEGFPLNAMIESPGRRISQPSAFIAPDVAQTSNYQSGVVLQGYYNPPQSNQFSSVDPRSFQGAPSSYYGQNQNGQGIPQYTLPEGSGGFVNGPLPPVRRMGQPAYVKPNNTPLLSLMSDLDSAPGATLGGTYVTPPQLSAMQNHSMLYPGQQQNTIVEDPHSYGMFDQQRPLSSTPNQTQPQWFAIPANSGQSFPRQNLGQFPDISASQNMSRQRVSSAGQNLPRQSSNNSAWRSLLVDSSARQSLPGPVEQIGQQSLPRQSMAGVPRQSMTGQDLQRQNVSYQSVPAVPTGQSIRRGPSMGHDLPSNGPIWQSTPRQSIAPVLDRQSSMQVASRQSLPQIRPSSPQMSKPDQFQTNPGKCVQACQCPECSRSNKCLPRSRSPSPQPENSNFRNAETSPKMRSTGTTPKIDSRSNAASQATACEPQCTGNQNHQFYKSTDREGQFNDQNRNGRRSSPGSTYGQPMGYSTPQQPIVSQDLPQAPGRKAGRSQRPEIDMRRPFDMEFSDDTEGDSGKCRCVERMRKFRKRRPVCYPMDGYDDYRQCPSLKYFYHPCL